MMVLQKAELRPMLCILRTCKGLANRCCSVLTPQARPVMAPLAVGKDLWAHIYPFQGPICLLSSSHQMPPLTLIPVCTVGLTNTLPHLLPVSAEPTSVLLETLPRGGGHVHSEGALREWEQRSSQHIRRLAPAWK